MAPDPECVGFRCVSFYHHIDSKFDTLAVLVCTALIGVVVQRGSGAGAFQHEPALAVGRRGGVLGAGLLQQIALVVVVVAVVVVGACACGGCGGGGGGMCTCRV